MPTSKNNPQGRDCRKCPSFVAGQKQVYLLGADLNTPICGTKMLPLINPEQPTETKDRVFKHHAKGCNKFGEAVESWRPLSVQDTPQLTVGFDIQPARQPDPDANQAAPLSSSADCRWCANFIPPAMVAEKYGWVGGVCRATGNLMLPDRFKLYAKKCGSFVRETGVIRDSRTATFNLLPIFGMEFGKPDVAGSYRRSVTNLVDPLDYPTDRPVGEGAKRRGIIAWRRISDPEEYGEDVYLPIFGRDLFDPPEQAAIPKTDDPERPGLYADHSGLVYTAAVLWMKLDEAPALWGQGGVGKTEFMRHLAWLMGAPFHRISITGSTELDDIAGKMLFREGETKFNYGRLSSAWTRPGVILLDEPNTGPPEVWQFIRPLTDNSRTLMLDQNEGERLARHVDCYFGMAMNPAWDPRNVGAATIGDADNSRLVHMYFDFPPDPLEREIIQQRVKLDGWEVPADKMDAMMKVCRDLRQASLDGILHTTWGIRHQIKLARALRYFTPLTAYRRAIGDALEPSQMETIKQIVVSYFGE